LEIETEYAICRQNPFIFGIYRWCLESGKRVAFISDTYLPESVIAELLRRNGYGAYELLLASSAFGRTKDEGSLHGEARSRLVVGRWLHIGDNYRADIQMARKHDMKAWYYRRCVGEFKRGYPLPYPWSGDAPEQGSVAHGLVANRTSHARPAPRYRKDSAAFWHDFGYATAGPLLVGFAEWLIARAAAHQLQALYFLARDGRIVRQVFEALAPLSGTSLETHYLWASRRAVNVASIEELDEPALDFLTAGSKTLAPKDYLARIGLNWADHLDAFRIAGFTDPGQRINGLNDELRLRRLFALLAEPVREHARVERSILTDYLRHSGLEKGRRVGVVDVGWRGSLQRSISDVLEVTGGGPEIMGFYFGTGIFLGTLKQHTPLFSSKYPHEAYLFRLGQPPDLAALIRTSIDVVELLFSAPEGSIIRIERDPAGNFFPIRDDESLDDDRNDAIRRLQAGALEFVDEYSALKRRFPDLTVSRQAATGQLRRVLRFPSRIEGELIGDIAHDDPFGEIRRRQLARPPNWLRLLAGRRAFYYALRDVCWGPGRDARLSPLGRAVVRLLMRNS
jgi:predicted HAD superfamily hydrolase